MYNSSIFIFHRDFRLKDNIGLYESLHQSEKVYCLFIFTNKQIINNPYKSEKSIIFMIESLLELKEEMKGYNMELFFLFEDNLSYNKLETFCKSENVECIFTNKDYTPFSKERENKYEHISKKLKIEYKSYHDYNLFEPNEIQTISGKHYEKFTPFYMNCLSNYKLIPKPLSMFQKQFLKKKGITISNINNNTKKILIDIYDIYKKFKNFSTQKSIKGGRKKGLQILNQIQNKKWKNYDNMRNQLTYSTTRLSAYLKYGCISIRETFYTMKDSLGLKHSLLRQLIWREFYSQLLDAKPELLKGKSLKPKYDKIKWNSNKNWENAWKNGTTGIPIIDACMRELNETGYMHNRGRLLVAECLIKLMGIDWRVGEKYFATKLIDYDPASNNGNWQWVSGSGADSQPYFRIMNIWKQGEKYDTNAEYIKKWVPELKHIHKKHIHEWYDFYNEYNLKDIKYYKPIFDYSIQREKVLEMYKKYL